MEGVNIGHAQDSSAEEDDGAPLQSDECLHVGAAGDDAIEPVAGDERGGDGGEDAPLPAAGEVGAVELAGNQVGHPTRPGRSAESADGVHQKHQDEEDFHCRVCAESLEDVDGDERDGDPEEALGVERPEEDAFAFSRAVGPESGGHGKQRGDEGQRGEQAELEFACTQALREARERSAAGGGSPGGTENPREGDEAHGLTQLVRAELIWIRGGREDGFHVRPVG